MGSKIHQVTHITGYKPTVSRVAPDEAALLYRKLCSGEPMNPEYTSNDCAGFMRNPHVVKQEAEKVQTALLMSRERIDATARREQAEQIKADANAALKAGNSRVALLGYVLGIWHVRSTTQVYPPIVPHVLANGKLDDEEALARFAKVPSSLRGIIFEQQHRQQQQEQQSSPPPPGDDDESAPPPPPPPPLAPDDSLLLSLHLNAAAAALKLDEWETCKAACEVVLSVDEANSKARFRLAKAHEGEGDVAKALSVVTALLQADAQNADARRLLETLRKRRAEEKASFKGIFDAPPKELS